MAARSDIAPARWRRPFPSWLDGIEAGWAIPLLLIGFTAVSLAFLIIAYLYGEPHPHVWATARGATAAVAMLGRYCSVLLIGSFVFAAICHPQRRAYFGSLAPWVSSVTGFLALGPHLHWLATTGAMPFTYALERHTGKV